MDLQRSRGPGYGQEKLLAWLLIVDFSTDYKKLILAFDVEVNAWKVVLTIEKGVRNSDILLTYIVMEVLAGKVMEYARKVPQGTPVSAKELLHLGNRAAVDQTLSRLVRHGKLMRAGRGLYIQPVASRFGSHPPEASKVVEAIAAQRGERVAPHGAAAANELGLTSQVPVREVYLTSGRSRSFKLGAQTIELRHVPGWQLALPGRPAGAVIRALAWLGPKRAGEALRKLRQKLPLSELEAVLGVRGRLPTWLAEEVSTLSNSG